MSIRQQGGIFGRNPTFNDLTVDGSVSVPNDSISGDAINGGTATPDVLQSSIVLTDGFTEETRFLVTTGAGNINVVLEAQNYSLYVVNADAGNAIYITVPNPASYVGRRIEVVKSGSNTVRQIVVYSPGSTYTVIGSGDLTAENAGSRIIAVSLGDAWAFSKIST